MNARAHTGGFMMGRWRAEASYALRGFVVKVLIVTVSYYLVLWLLAWTHGAIPQQEDYYGNHGPWKRMIMSEGMAGEISAFSIMASLLIYSFLAVLGCLVASMAAFILKPGLKGLALIALTLMLGIFSGWHLVLVD